MLTHIRLDKKIEQSIKEIIEIEHFSNKSEFIRDAIRKSIEDYKSKIAKEIIAKHFRSTPDKKVNREERKKVVEEYLKSGRDVFKEIGLK